MNAVAASVAAVLAHTDFSQFAIGFDPRDRARLHALWDEVIDSDQWSHGAMNRRFEAAWAALERPPAPSRLLGWAGGALAALEFAGVRRAGRCSAPPTRSWPRRWRSAGRRRGRSSSTATATTCACRFATSRRRPSATGPRAAVLVHIGGHLAFDSERIAELLPRPRDLPARGLRARPRRARGTGGARAPSATPASTPSTPPRRSRPARAACSSPAATTCSTYARAFRDYGKPDYAVAGPQLPHERVHRRARRSSRPSGWRRSWPGRTRSPASTSTRAIPDRLRAARRHGLGPLQVHRLRPDRALDRQGLRPSRATGSWARGDDLPNTDWVAENHWCVPLYYRPGGDSTHELVSSSPAGPASSAPTSSTASPRPATSPRIYDMRAVALARPARSRPSSATSATPRRRDARGARLRGVCHLAAAADVEQVHAEPADAERAQRPRHAARARGRAAARDVARVVYASTIWVYSDVDADERRRGHAAARRPRTSTRRPSSPASCTAAPTPSSTASSTRSCASASPTARARGRRP